MNLSILFLGVQGFPSEQELLKYYFKNPNGTIFAVNFKGNWTHFDYAIRYHDQYNSFNDFLNTRQLFSDKSYQQYHHKGK